MQDLDDMDGLKIGGTVVNNLRYADDHSRIRGTTATFD